MKAEQVKLSQWDALMIEGLRGLGWSNDEIVERVRHGTNLPVDESIFQFDYSGLAAFAEKDPATFQAAVRNGYQIKYNTIGGIRSWILVAFGKEPLVNREAGQESVTAELTPDEYERLASVLSFGWSIKAESGAGESTDGAAAAATADYRITPSNDNGIDFQN